MGSAGQMVMIINIITVQATRHQSTLRRLWIEDVSRLAY